MRRLFFLTTNIPGSFNFTRYTGTPFNLTNYFSLADVVLIPLNLLLVVILTGRMIHSLKGEKLYRWFWWAFFIRILAGFAYYLYHRYVYQGGDVFNYYQGIKEYHLALWYEPVDWFRSLFQDPESFSPAIKSICKHEFHYTGEEGFLIRTSSIMAIFGLNSFMGINIWMSFYSFVGSTFLYRVFSERYPEFKYPLFIPFMFIPSVFFWSSCITKEALILFAFGIFFYGFNDLFMKKNWSIKNIFFVLIGGYAVAMIKGYILVLIFPAILFLLFHKWIHGIHSRFLRWFSIPVFLYIMMLGTSWLYNRFSSSPIFNQYLSNQVAERIKGQYNYLAIQTEARSSYDLGPFEPTPEGIAKIFPKSIVVSLFRPFPYEINSIPLLISGLESLLSLAITLLLILHLRVYHFFRILFADPYLIFSLIFVLSYAGLIGITSGNFGSLMRFKLPILPYFFAILTITYYQYRTYKQKN